MTDERELAREVLEALGWTPCPIHHRHLTSDGKCHGDREAPNLLSLDVLLPMSDEWAFSRDCWWEDKTDNDGGEYSSTLKTIDLEPARHVVVVASGTFYDVDNVGPLDARVAARLKAWLAALKGVSDENDTNI